MFVSNRHGFFPRNFRIQPARYMRFHDAWGAIFESPNGDEFLILLHLRQESMYNAMTRSMRQGRHPYDVQREKVVDGFQVFRIHKGAPLAPLTQILLSLDQAVRYLESIFNKMS